MTDLSINLNDIFALNLAADRWQTQGLRAVIAAQSGGGKTNLCAVIYEELHRLHIPYLIIDPMDDFRSLRELGDVTVVSCSGGDAELIYPANDWCEVAIRQLAKNRSVVVDLSGLNAMSDKRVAYTWLARRLLSYQQKTRLPMFMGIEEAHIFAPAKRSQDAESLYVTADIARLGRRNGINLLLSSQRPRDLEADVRSQCNLHFIGHIEDHLDYEAVAPSLVLPQRNGRGRVPAGLEPTRVWDTPGFGELMDLRTGQFYCRIGTMLHLVYVRKRRTKHIGQTPVIQGRLPF
ncbi:MAG: ATP-binding protein [Anaerolineae bacterium]|nr:ATP-binding protein [Anaerolineae bacterium]